MCCYIKGLLCWWGLLALISHAVCRNGPVLCYASAAHDTHITYAKVMPVLLVIAVLSDPYNWMSMAWLCR